MMKIFICCIALFAKESTQLLAKRTPTLQVGTPLRRMMGDGEFSVGEKRGDYMNPIGIARFLP